MLQPYMHTWFQYLQNSVCYFLQKEFDEFQIENVIFSITFLKIKNVIDQISTSIAQFFFKHREYSRICKLWKFCWNQKERQVDYYSILKELIFIFSGGLATMTFVKTTPFGVVLKTVELIPMK